MQTRISSDPTRPPTRQWTGGAVLQRQPAPAAPQAAPQTQPTAARFSSIDLAPRADTTAANPELVEAVGRRRAVPGRLPAAP